MDLGAQHLHHRDLIALVELGTVEAVGEDLVRQRAVLDHAEAKTVVIEAEFLDHLDKMDLPRSPQIVVIGDSSHTSYQDWIAGQPTTDPNYPTEVDDTGVQLYTSGTTGLPKGAELSNRNFESIMEPVSEMVGLTADSVVLHVLPLFHINGLCVTLLAPLLSGGSTVLPPRFSAAAFWNQVGEHGVSWFSVVPTQVSYLSHAEGEPGEVPWLRFGRSASAPLAPELLRGFERRFGVPLIETMGLTETAAQILSNPMPPAARRACDCVRRSAATLTRGRCSCAAAPPRGWNGGVASRRRCRPPAASAGTVMVATRRRGRRRRRRRARRPQRRSPRSPSSGWWRTCARASLAWRRR